MYFLVAAVLATAGPQDPAPATTAEFVSLIHSLQAEIRSISFLFEGEMHSLKDGAVDPARSPIRFQGHYAFRPGKSQAGLLEFYEGSTPAPPTHRSIALLNGELERSNRPRVPGLLDPKTKKPMREYGGPGSLGGSPSPESFVYSWYFSEYGPSPEPGMFYENLGWEDVAGHRCMKVKLSGAPGNSGKVNYTIFWIDIARGGHPLKVEDYYKDDLISRVDSIELTSATTADGKSAWFPVAGEVNVYGSIGAHSRTPTARETYGVVLGSLRLNIDLPDSVFVVHTKPRREIGNANALRANHPVEAKPAKVVALKTDPESVKARLDASLAEADRQAKEIEASSPARSSWGWTGGMQVAFALAGVALIGFAGFWTWRRS